MTASFWIPGNDVYQIQWYWINFIAVHVKVLDTECGMTTEFKNPFGFGYKQKYTIKSEYFVNEYTKMSGWNDFKTSALKESFVTVPTATVTHLHAGMHAAASCYTGGVEAHGASSYAQQRGCIARHVLAQGMHRRR